jgi:hypothetical protein
MTRLEMEAKIYDWLNKAGTATIDAITQRRIRGFLNDDIRDVLTRPGMESLRATTTTFATVASQDAYGLPLQFTKIDRIVDRTNFRTLEEKDLSWLRDVQPNPTRTGNPYAWVPYGWQAVAIQPSAPLELFVQSSSAADTTQTVAVEGYTTGGVFRAPAAVTLNGTTLVSISASTTTWETVSKFYIASGTPAGFINLVEQGTGTVLASINTGKSSRYQAIRLWPTPAAAATLYVDGIRAITDLAGDFDSPSCPVDFHECFIVGACKRELARLADDRLPKFEQWHERWIGRMRGWVNDNASLRLIPQSRSVGWNNLGPFFPSDGYR